MRITDTITFSQYKKIANDDKPKELIEFLKTSGLMEKLSSIGEDVISIVEHMDDLK